MKNLSKDKATGQSQTKPARQGFTIIEVVLVLAIAGLIMAMVFIGLPSLQRTQRNKQRKDDIARVASAVQEYQSHNSGRLPLVDDSVDPQFVLRYVDESCKAPAEVTDWTIHYTDCSEKFTDPSGINYAISGMHLPSNLGLKNNKNTEIESDISLAEMVAEPPEYYDENFGFAAEGVAEDIRGGYTNVIMLIGNSYCTHANGQLYFTPADNQNAYSVAYELEGGDFTCVDNS